MARCNYYVDGPWAVHQEHLRRMDEARDEYGSESKQYKELLVGGPEWDMDAEQEALDALMAKSDEATVSNPVGFVLSFPVADGGAFYRVEKTSPFTLAWIPYGDAYSIPEAHMRGLRLADVKDHIRFRDSWSKLRTG